MNEAHAFATLATFCGLGCVFFSVSCRLAVKRAQKLQKELHEMTMRAQTLHAANVTGDKTLNLLTIQHNGLIDRHDKLKSRLRGLNALQRKNLGIKE